MTPEEKKELVGEVAKERGVLLSPDDPLFLMIELSETVLERTAHKVMQEMGSEMDAMGARLEERVRKAQTSFLQQTVTAVSDELEKLALAHERGIGSKAQQISQNLDRLGSETARLTTTYQKLLDQQSRKPGIHPLLWVFIGVCIGALATWSAVVLTHV